MATRPTPDRVREALFSILADAVDEAVVLDLFAGSGALGLEALSRGARHAVFVEQARNALGVLRENIRATQSEACEVLAMPVVKALGALAERGALFDLIFLDPPYDAGELTPTLNRILACGLAAQGGLIVCEHRGNSQPPEAGVGLRRADTRVYGDVALTFFVAETPEGKEEPIT